MKRKTPAVLVVATLFAAITIPVRLAAQQHRYKLVDIGTFAGPASFINPSGNGGPYISSRGTTVGTAATSVPSNPATHGFFCSGLDGSLPFVFHAFKWQNGRVTDLGALPPAADNCSDALAVNASGEIAGGSENGVIEPVMGITQVRAVRWKDGDIEDLGTFGGNLSQAYAINDRGQIVGFALNEIPDPFSMFYKLFGFGLPSVGTQTRAFLWEKGRMQDLGTLGGPDAQPSFVNDRGQVIGLSYTNWTPNPTTNLPTADPFLWTKDGGMIDLGTLGGVFGTASLLNNRGQVVGTSSLASDPGACFSIGNTANCHPFLWDEGKLIDLTAQSGGVIATANAINDAGEVVGAANFPNQPFAHAYIWRNGVATDLGILPGHCFSQASAINSRGQVVGQSISCDGSGSVFLWEKGSMIDLDTFVPPNSGLLLAETIGINDRGEIGGDLLPPGCTQDVLCGHAYVLIPVGENDTEGITAASQGKSARVNQNHTTVTPDSQAAKEMMARILARPAHRFVAWPRR